jgi:hypothetical protein
VLAERQMRIFETRFLAMHEFVYNFAINIKHQYILTIIWNTHHLNMLHSTKKELYSIPTIVGMDDTKLQLTQLGKQQCHDSSDGWM